MSAPFVKYVAFFAKPGKRQELLDRECNILLSLIQKEVLANEPGTKHFALVTDSENGELITWQEYANEQALEDRHNGKTHALWVEKKGDLVESFVSRKLPYV